MEKTNGMKVSSGKYRYPEQLYWCCKALKGTQLLKDGNTALSELTKASLLRAFETSLSNVDTTAEVSNPMCRLHYSFQHER